ncbi:MAG: efflux RND transporter periplasmic adaptor subunit [Bacteroidota bacterium]
MTSRKVLVTIGVLLLFAALFGSWLIMRDGEQPTTSGQSKAIVQVPVLKANPQDLTLRISFTGRVIPEQQINIHAEVTGRMETVTPRFKIGNRFKQGAVLVRINDEEFHQQVQVDKYRFAALLSRILPDISVDYPEAFPAWNTYLANLESESVTPPLPETGNRQFQLFLINRDVYSHYHTLKQREIQLAKFTIKAPFDGVLTETLADPGDLIQPNQQLGEFTKVSELEIEASIPARVADQIEIGDPVTLNLEHGSLRQLQAQVVRKNAKIDPSTQSVSVFLQIDESSLKPGSYVQGTILGAPFSEAVQIPSQALIRDHEIFIVEDSTAVLKSIEPVSTVRDSVVIQGVAPGTLIITEFHSPAFAGTKVAPLQN